MTGERAVDQKIVDSVLSVMTTCGMYDFAGEWVYAVGMPAKSGVAGGVLAVLPGQLGIGVFSPRLDARGNSVRGVAVCSELSRDFDLHFLRVPRSARSTIRAEYDLAQHALAAPAHRGRARGARRRRRTGARSTSCRATCRSPRVEALVRRIVDAAARDRGRRSPARGARSRRARRRCSASLVADLERAASASSWSPRGDQGGLAAQLEEAADRRPAAARCKTFPDLDPALEWCETEVLRRCGRGARRPPSTLAEHDVCRGLDAAALAHARDVRRGRVASSRAT